VYLIGAPELTSLYAEAATLIGIGTEILDPQVGTRAMFRLGAMLSASHGGPA
jgi:hypothetical protein